MGEISDRDATFLSFMSYSAKIQNQAFRVCSENGKND